MIEPRSPALQADSLPAEPQAKPLEDNVSQTTTVLTIENDHCLTTWFLAKMELRAEESSVEVVSTDVVAERRVMVAYECHE